jgi:hypothetical protein
MAYAPHVLAPNAKAGTRIWARHLTQQFLIKRIKDNTPYSVQT